MATKRAEIHISHITGEMFVVWIDSNEDSIRDIEGVASVNAYSGIHSKFHVYLDPRYDADAVLADIRALAERCQ